MCSNWGTLISQWAQTGKPVKIVQEIEFSEWNSQTRSQIDGTLKFYVTLQTMSLSKNIKSLYTLNSTKYTFLIP